MANESEWQTARTVLEEGFYGGKAKASQLESLYGGRATAQAMDVTQNATRYRRAIRLSARLRDKEVRKELGPSLWQQAVEEEREQFYQPQAITLQRVYRGKKARQEKDKRKASLGKIKQAVKSWRERKNL